MNTIFGIRTSLYQSPYSASPLRQAPTVLGKSLVVSGTLVDTLADDDAVKITISSPSKSDATSRSEVVIGTPRRSPLGSLMDQVSSIADRLKKLSAITSESGITAGQRDAAQNEIANLNAQYSELTQDGTLTRLAETLRQVQSALQSGTSGRSIYNYLGTGGGLLGEGFLGAVQRGDLFSISTLSSSFDSLLTLDPNSGDASVFDQIRQAATSAQKVLSGAGPAEAVAIATGQSSTSKEAPIITAQQSTVAGPQGINLALRSFSSQDLIQAAMTGAQIGPIAELYLTAKPAEEDEDEKQPKPADAPVS